MLIDIGVNLTSGQFASDYTEVIERARQAGVEKMIITGTNVPESIQAEKMAAQQPGCLYSTAGIHPHHAKEFEKGSISVLSGLLDKQSVVAVGECGLDYNRNFSEPADQRCCFSAQLELAAEKNRPVFLHQRDAHEDFVKLLSEYLPQIPAAVAHCFTGSADEMQQYIDMGLYIGITGWICDERRGQELKSIVNTIPADRLMIETDAPYLLPRDLQPKPKSRRNEPMYLPHIAEVVASCYGINVIEIAERTAENTRRFFNLC